MRMGYIDYVPKREELDFALDGSPILRKHAISAWAPGRSFCMNQDTLLFRDGKRRTGWNAHTGTWLPKAGGSDENLRHDWIGAETKRRQQGVVDSA
jgi:hypothetical protein